MSRISDLAGFTTAISTTEDLSVGIITASSFSGNLTGDVTGTATGLAAGATGSDLTLSGNLSIGGTLTYQDVTNVDAVGMVTARKGLQVLADGLDVTGVGTFKSNVSIADSFIHTGDTDTLQSDSLLLIHLLYILMVVKEFVLLLMVKLVLEKILHNKGCTYRQLPQHTFRFRIREIP